MTVQTSNINSIFQFLKELVSICLICQIIPKMETNFVVYMQQVFSSERNWFKLSALNQPPSPAKTKKKKKKIKRRLT